MGRLVGKNILITGGTSGIGRAAAIKSAENGANVVICGRNDSRGMDVVAEINKHNVKAKFIKCDVTVKDDISKLFDQTISYLGKIDCAFNNAGIEGEMAMFAESTEENWDKVLDSNLKSIWYCMKLELDHMLTQGSGNIVNMASTSGLIGNGFGLTAYAASKHAVIGLTKSVALEYAKQNIRVNAICPAFVRTPMVDNMCEKYPKLKRRCEAAQPIGRMATAEEIANAVVYLCSDESSFIIGNSLVIDGGLTI